MFILKNIQNHVAINDELVDAEGFPRNDVDVRTVRIARQQILCLQNDLKDLMKEIEKGLEEIHADGQENLNTTKLAPENRNNGPAASGSRNSSVTNLQNQTPIVIVNLVSQDSPAMVKTIKWPHIQRISNNIIQFLGSRNTSQRSHYFIWNNFCRQL